MEKRLTATRAVAIAKPGSYADGGALYLQAVMRNGKLYKSWVHKYRSPTTGKLREMGLGPLHRVSVAQARTDRDAARDQLRAGRDPIEEKGRAAAREAEQSALDAARFMTFDDCAAAYFLANKCVWHNAKHAKQIAASLKTYVSPVFGKTPVAMVDRSMVIKALERNNFWNATTETASRVRARIELIIDWAEARGYRPEGVNPASWKKLSMILPSRRKIRPVEHFAAMPYAELPAFMKTLSGIDTLSALALRFTILTAVRAGEAAGARWDEIDFNTKVWTIPASRMKMGREHRVPLSEDAVHLLQKMLSANINSYVFPGRLSGSLGPDTMFDLLCRMGHDVTVHGFRSSFRDWAGNETHHARETCEAALAHASGDSTEQAYRRGDAIEKRRALMQDWADFLTKK